MYAHEDEDPSCNSCESVADTVCRFLTKVWFTEGKLGKSWAEMCGYLCARLQLTSSKMGASSSGHS